MSKKRFATALIVLTLLLSLVPSTVLARGPRPPGPPASEATNNLSFPAIAVDGFVITPVTTPSFTVPYAGTYPGLTAEEIAALQAAGPWYPQKTTGNAWQADFANQGTEAVTFIDWGDNVESVYPKVRRPFRLEVTLYKQLETPLTAYTMAVLEYPSSSNELQGTNTTTYENSFATVVSAKPKFVIQYLGDAVPALAWNGTEWIIPPETEGGDPVTPTIIPISFGPELNVGGKYVFGASTGGWKPDKVGYYRLTFYVPAPTGLNLALATIGNYAVFSAPAGITAEEGDTAVAEPKVDATNNLTYVDVLVVAGGGK